MLPLLRRLSSKSIQIIAILALSLCSIQPLQAGDKGVDTIVKNGTLKVGVSGNQPPYVMHDDAGKLMGFDVDLAMGLAAAMNVEVEFVEMPFADLLSALDKRKVDLVMSGMDITLERSSRAMFVGPYSMAGKSILTSKASIDKFSQSSELNRAGAQVVALAGSTSVDFVKQLMPDVQLTPVKDYDTGVDMVKSGAADFMVADMAICVLTVIMNPDSDLAALPKPLSLQPVGIAVNAKHPNLHALVNSYLDSFEKLGMLQKIRVKWFENGDWVRRLPGKKITL